MLTAALEGSVGTIQLFCAQVNKTAATTVSTSVPRRSSKLSVCASSRLLSVGSTCMSAQ
jgi:hypothetical protein